jgi:hypothetical protein
MLLMILSISSSGDFDIAQAQAVGHHKDAAGSHRGGSQHRVQQSSHGGWDEDHIVDKGPE